MTILMMPIDLPGIVRINLMPLRMACSVCCQVLRPTPVGLGARYGGRLGMRDDVRQISRTAFPAPLVGAPAR